MPPKTRSRPPTRVQLRDFETANWSHNWPRFFIQFNPIYFAIISFVVSNKCSISKQSLGPLVRRGRGTCFFPLVRAELARPKCNRAGLVRAAEGACLPEASGPACKQAATVDRPAATGAKVRRRATSGRRARGDDRCAFVPLSGL